MPDLKLPVERLTARPEPFAFEAGAGWWRARVAGDGGASQAPAASGAEREAGASEEEIAEPFRFDVRACRVGDDLLLEGEMRGRLSLECSRCGKRYDHALREPWRLRLEPVDERAEIDPDGEAALGRNGLCLGEDLEAGWYRGPLLRLDEFFGELIALAMPLQPLCDEACPGVCPHCGAPRAVGSAQTEGGADAQVEATCSCEDERVESPFAVLAQLKKN